MVAADAAETFNLDGWRQCADFGVLGMPIPEEYGGLGLGLSALLAVMEGLGYGTRDQGLLFSLNAHLWTNSIPILQYGTTAQRARYLPGLCDGTLIGANAAPASPRPAPTSSACGRARERDGDPTCSTARRCGSPTRRSPTCSSPTRRPTPRWARWASPAFIIERETPGFTIGRKLAQDGPAHLADGGGGLRGLPRAGGAAARPRRARRRGVRVLDGVGARLHPRQLPRRDAAAARGMHPARPRAQAVRHARSASSSRSPTGSST